MKVTPFVVKDRVVCLQTDPFKEPIILDSLAWFEWLENVSCFNFKQDENSTGFTAYKECTHKRGGYWKAYYRSNKKLQRVYLGKSHNLHLKRLISTAQLFQNQNTPGRNTAKKPSTRNNLNTSYGLTTSTLTLKKEIEKSPAVQPKFNWAGQPANNLLLSKILLPVPRKGGVVRIHLLKQLDEALQSKLIVVNAGGGFGKTTLLSTWAAALSELEIAPPVATADFMYAVAINPRIFGNKAVNIGKVSYNGSDPNIEELAAFKPDLVISDFGSGRLRDTLKTIAPFYLMGEIKNVQTAGNELKKLAGLFGRNQQAETAIKRLNDKLAAYKAKSPRDLSILIMANYTQGLQQFVGTDETSYCSILTEIVKSCGIKAPAMFAGFAQASLENILQTDPQALFVISVMAAPAGAYPQTTVDQQVQNKKELENSALWKAVSAVKNGRLYEVDRSGWYSTSGTRSLGFVLDDVMTKLYPAVFPKPLP